MLIMGREKEKRSFFTTESFYIMLFFVCLSKPGALVEATLLIVMMGNIGDSLP